jgi:UDP-N-acetylmuramoyl-tripeptide--D-alanyl-D-alanine ligase
MEELNLKTVSAFSHGEIDQSAGSVCVTGVSTDSREIKSGDLFVALKGEKFNGHDYLQEVSKKGAVAAMVETGEMRGRKSPVPMVLVDDVLRGLQSFAGNYRLDLSVRNVAVAGSNGKTGTKEMIAAVLGTKFSVLKNKGNLNNHIGVPVSLLRLDRSHEIGVFEIGTNHPGELLPLLELVRPLAGVITMIGEEHLEFFHDLEGVSKEEGMLAEALPKEGLLVLNADDPWSQSIAKRCKCKILQFGFKESADYCATEYSLSGSGTSFVIKSPKGKVDVRLKLIGRHQVSNALAACAIGDFFGVSLQDIRRGLESVTAYKMRMELRTTRNGVLIINDAYNANPSSMRVALEAVRDLEVQGKRYAVLGEMRELGEASRDAHFEIGKKVAECGMDVLVGVGSEVESILQGAESSITPPSQIKNFKTPSEAREFLKLNAKDGDVVLLKASRGVALERVLEGWE